VTSFPPAPVSNPTAQIDLLDRDGSILAFNERVLDWAKRPEVPILERLRYLCIVSSNLDEFFEVRADLHMAAYRNQDTKGAYNLRTFEKVYQAARSLVTEQYRLYNDVLLPSLEHEGIQILSHGNRNSAQKKWVHEYFKREVKPLLVPVGLDPAHPFPQVANKSLNFIVQLSGKDAFGRSNDIAIVKVPRVLPRVIRLPAKLAGNNSAFVLLSSVIRAHLEDLFPGRHVGQFSQFRVTRNSDLSVDEEEVENLRTALRKGLQHRQYGQALRLEVSDGCSEHLSVFLLNQFGLPSEYVALLRLRAFQHYA
jgi:polyphosphate kinase